MEKISVIIPVYNTGKYLYRCFDSLVNQTVGLSNLEVLIVDDGSTDSETIRIIDEYVNKYPDNFISLKKKNGGQGSARNLAFSKMTGDYFTCLDSDDFFEPDWAEKMYGAAKENDSDFVTCGYKTVVIEEDNSTREMRGMVMRKPCASGREMILDALVNMFTCLVKRDVIEDSGARYPEGLIYEDMAFYIEMLPWVKKPYFIEESLGIRTCHEGSTMTNVKPEKISNVFGVMKAMIEFYRNKGIYENYRDELEYFIGKVLLCSGLRRVGFIKGTSARGKLVRETISFLKEYLPDFKSNKYIGRDKLGVYLRHYNYPLLRVLAEILRIRFVLRKDYLT